MRWSRRIEQEQEQDVKSGEWHEGAHWVAGAGAVVKAQRAADLVTDRRSEAA